MAMVRRFFCFDWMIHERSIGEGLISKLEIFDIRADRHILVSNDTNPNPVAFGKVHHVTARRPL
jgi:hypothetical protein